MKLELYNKEFMPNKELLILNNGTLNLSDLKLTPTVSNHHCFNSLD
jgi:hypothetical protein